MNLNIFDKMTENERNTANKNNILKTSYFSIYDDHYNNSKKDNGDDDNDGKKDNDGEKDNNDAITDNKRNNKFEKIYLLSYKDEKNTNNKYSLFNITSTLKLFKSSNNAFIDYPQLFQEYYQLFYEKLVKFSNTHNQNEQLYYYSEDFSKYISLSVEKIIFLCEQIVGVSISDKPYIIGLISKLMCSYVISEKF